MACMETDEKIKNYALDNEVNSNGQIDLDNMSKFIKSMRKDWKTVTANSNYIKLENVSENLFDTSNVIVKQEEFQQIEDNEFQIKTEEPLLKSENEIELYSEATSKDEDTLRKYRCQYCTFKSKWQDILNRHIKVVHETEKLEFPNRDTQFSIFESPCEENLIKPLGVDKNTTPVKCHKCHEDFDSRIGFESHVLEQHHEILHLVKSRIYCCDFCDYKTLNVDDMSHHMTINHSQNTIHKYRCYDCDYTCVVESELANHVCVEYKDLKENVQLDSRDLHNHADKSKMLSDVSIEPEDAVKKHHCPHCSFKSKRKDHVTRHIIVTHEKEKLEILGCDKCTFQTHHKGNLTRHRRVHDDKASFKCHKCHKGFNWKISFERHILEHHPDLRHLIKSKLYSCGFCDYETVTAGKMTRHLLNDHIKSIATKYGCNICNYNCMTKTALTSHLRSHSKSRRFFCVICHKNWKSKVHFDSHVVRNHADNVELLKTVTHKICRCNVCAYTTTRMSHFKDHMKVHEKKSSNCS